MNQYLGMECRRSLRELSILAFKGMVFNNCCLMVINYLNYNYETIACFQDTCFKKFICQARNRVKPSQFQGVKELREVCSLGGFGVKGA